ncbi:MAG: type II CAAX endopeptidase family protein [Minisyncoccia bacterium]
MHLPSKRLIITQIFIIFVLPVVVLYFNILSSDWRIVLLAVSSLFIYGIIRHEHWTHEDMGIRHDNLTKAFLFYLFFTVLGIGFLFLLDHKINMPDIDTKIFFIKTFVFFLPISFFQEFAFRSFLIPRLKQIFTSSYVVVLVNALLFTLIHVIYPNLGIGLPIAFVSGIFFAWLYLKYPNLLLVSWSHAALNLTAVILGFFHIS